MQNIYIDHRKLDPKFMRFSSQAGMYLYLNDAENAGKSAIDSYDYDVRRAGINNECITCYFRKKNIVNKIDGISKENDILLESFNSGIAYNIDKNQYYICE